MSQAVLSIMSISLSVNGDNTRRSNAQTTHIQVQTYKNRLGFNVSIFYYFRACSPLNMYENQKIVVYS